MNIENLNTKTPDFAIFKLLNIYRQISYQQ